MRPAAANRESSHAGERANDVSVTSAVRRLCEDGLVAFPTETVWGLAARAESERALAALRRWKRRTDDQPISVLVPEGFTESSGRFVIDAASAALIDAFWPGPLTLVLPSRAPFASGVARRDGAVGVRCSSHPRAAALARAAAEAGIGPITATSLNRHAEPPACNVQQARALCGAPVADVASPLVLETLGEDAHDEAPSSVVDLASDPPALLRRGPIDADAIERAAGIVLHVSENAVGPVSDPSSIAAGRSRSTTRRTAPGEENE